MGPGDFAPLMGSERLPPFTSAHPVQDGKQPDHSQMEGVWTDLPADTKP